MAALLTEPPALGSVAAGLLIEPPAGTGGSLLTAFREEAQYRAAGALDEDGGAEA